MPSVQQQEFLFVNPGNKSRAGHKISTSGRAFVIRKARAAQPWSTKSKASTRREGSDDSGERSAGNNGTGTGSDSGGSDQLQQDQRLVFTPVDRVNPSQTTRAKRTGGSGVSKRKHISAGSNKRSEAASPLRDATAATALVYKNLSGRLDPFNALSVQMNERDTKLFAYFNTAIISTLTPLTGDQSPEAQRYWVTVSVDHSGFLHGMLCLSALQLAIAQPHQSPLLLERFMHHRIQAISHIQQCLADPTSALSDETVASVFQMLCIEENLILHAGDEAFTEYPAWKHMQPDSSQRKAHMAGLKRMLALRGGISELGNTRGLQAFLIRWVCTSLACRLVFALPDTKLYGPPTNKNELDSFMLDDTTFAASYLLPRGMLKKLYRYPETSPHYIPILSLDDPLATVECAMAWGCAKTKMNPELIRHIITIDCLLKDAMGWYYHRETYRQWDALDLQNLMSIGMGELVRWNLENEPFLSATENVTAMCLFLFTFFVGNGAHAACSPLPGIMPRLRLHFRDTKIRAWLQQAGIETWVGLLLCIASSQNPSSEQYFFRFLIEVLAVRQPPVTTYDEFRQTLLGGIWSPIMEGHAIKAWKEIEEPLKTATEALESRGSEAFSNVMRPRPKDAHLKPTIPMSNPYATSHMKKIFSSAKEEITVEVFKT